MTSARLNTATPGKTPVWSAVPMVLGLALTIGGCNSTPTVDRTFALTSTDATVNDDAPMPVNLTFIAAPQDPIWEDLDGLDLTGEDGQTVTTLTRDQFTVHAGDERDGTQLGNLTFDIPATVPDLHFTQVELHFTDSDEPATAAVGNWTITRRQSEPAVKMHGTYDIAVPECGTVTATFEPAATLEAVEVRDIATNAPGAAITDWSATPGTGNRIKVTFTLTCDQDAFDFYTITPHVLLEHDTSQTTVALDPISVGLLTVEDDDIERIASR